VNRDERCDRISHPLSYYGSAVEAGETGGVSDASATAAGETGDAADDT
jgi:hypothetical protein